MWLYVGAEAAKLDKRSMRSCGSNREDGGGGLVRGMEGEEECEVGDADGRWKKSGWRRDGWVVVRMDIKEKEVYQGGGDGSSAGV